jgi:DNA-binding HxlR family transcriptional regulator
MAVLGRRGAVLMSEQVANSSRCTAELVLAVLNGKWKTIILCRLNEHPCRYSELRAAIPGLSDKMLTQRLHDLIRCGLVEHQHPTKVPTGIYALTPKGKLLDDLLRGICAWGQRHTRAFHIDIGDAARACEARRRVR